VKSTKQHEPKLVSPNKKREDGAKPKRTPKEAWVKPKITNPKDRRNQNGPTANVGATKNLQATGGLWRKAAPFQGKV